MRRQCSRCGQYLGMLHTQYAGQELPDYVTLCNSCTKVFYAEIVGWVKI